MSCGQGTSSLVTAMEKDLPHLAQRVGEEGSSITSSGIADLCQTGTTGMDAADIEAASVRAERALWAAHGLAYEAMRNNQWDEAAEHANRSYAHLLQLIALSRIQPRSQA